MWIHLGNLLIFNDLQITTQKHNSLKTKFLQSAMPTCVHTIELWSFSKRSSIAYLFLSATGFSEFQDSQESRILKILKF